VALRFEVYTQTVTKSTVTDGFTYLSAYAAVYSPPTNDY